MLRIKHYWLFETRRSKGKVLPAATAGQERAEEAGRLKCSISKPDKLKIKHDSSKAGNVTLLHPLSSSQAHERLS